MARQRIINYHTSGTTAPLSDDIYYGELVVSHNSIGNTKIYTKVTNPSGDTNEGKIATFIDEPQIDEKISFSKTDEDTLSQLKLRIVQESPEKKAYEIRKTIQKLDELKSKIEIFKQSFSTNMSSKLQALKTECIEKEAASKKFADSLKDDCKLEGLGEKAWKDLWNAAKAYSAGTLCGWKFGTVTLFVVSFFAALTFCWFI